VAAPLGGAWQVIHAEVDDAGRVEAVPYS